LLCLVLFIFLIQQTEICNWHSADQQLVSTQHASAIGRNNALAFYCGQIDYYTLAQPQPQHSAATPQLHPTPENSVAAINGFSIMLSLLTKLGNFFNTKLKLNIK